MCNSSNAVECLHQLQHLDEFILELHVVLSFFSSFYSLYNFYFFVHLYSYILVSYGERIFEFVFFVQMCRLLRCVVKIMTTQNKYMQMFLQKLSFKLISMGFYICFAQYNYI